MAVIHGIYSPPSGTAELSIRWASIIGLPHENTYNLENEGERLQPEVN